MKKKVMSANKKSVQSSLQLIAAMVLALVLCVSLLLTYLRVRDNMQKSLISEAGDHITVISEQTDSFLQKAKTVVAVSTDAVEYMILQGAENSDILDFLLYQTDYKLAEIDERFMGV